MPRFQPLLLAFCLFFLAGCHREASDRVVIRIANWGGAKEGNKFDQTVAKIYDDFQRENPDIDVREESVPDEYVAKMSLAFIAGVEPDIMMLDASSSALFINSGMVTDLTPLIEKDKDFRLDDFFPNVVDIDRRGKALYAIPNDFTPMVVYYNKKLFDQAHVPYPTGDWDFEKFRETAKKLTTPGDPPSQYGYAFANATSQWVMWLWNNGAYHVAPDGSHVSGYLDSPKCVEAVSFLADLVNKDKVSPSISQAAAMGVDPFANGQAAMTVSGHWSLLGYDNAPKGADGKPKISWADLGVVGLPHNIPQSQTVMYESGFAIGAHSKHKEAAWRFIKYMTSHRAQIQYQEGGIAVCGRKDVAAERAKASKLEAEFLPLIPSSRPPPGANIEGYEFVETQAQSAMDSILQNGRNPHEAMTKAARAIDREFEKK